MRVRISLPIVTISISSVGESISSCSQHRVILMKLFICNLGTTYVAHVQQLNCAMACVDDKPQRVRISVFSVSLSMASSSDRAL